MTTVRSLLRQRRAELSSAMHAAMEEAAQKAAAPFLEQLREIEVALFALETQLPEGAAAAEDRAPRDVRPSPREVTKSLGMTLKEMVLLILGERHGGAEALSILDEINDRWNVGLQRTSLSPQLSRLKDEGKVKLTGKVWSLVEKNETPGAEAPGARTGAARLPEGPIKAAPTGSTPVASTDPQLFDIHERKEEE
ncbi:MAG TPA: hypothetical protein VF122_06435 [Caulobacteraceae bacterium]